VKPFERLDEAVAPDGTVLEFCRHDGSYVIRVDGEELMSTRRHHSEEALATLGCASIAGVPGARVLIGGLGLGFTLKATLGLLAPTGRVTVVELVDSVIRWNSDPEYGLSVDAMRDPRTTIRHDDVARTLSSCPATFDAILLDVDNGAEAMVTEGNAALYRDSGLRTAIAALKPNGTIAYWSSDPDARFETALRRVGLEVTTHTVTARPNGKGPKHVIFVGRRLAPRVG
jgi:spermidine synthase